MSDINQEVSQVEDESVLMTQEMSAEKTAKIAEKAKAEHIFPVSGVNFGKYEQLMEIGKGATATVFKAMDPALNRWVALKVLCAGTGYAEEMEQRFRQEMAILANLSIYGITAIFEQGQIDGFTYFAMEYVEGQTLDKYLESQDLTQDIKLQLLLDLSKILAELHEHSVCHRDIKPQNIMVDNKGKLRLMDLGIAKSLAEGQDIYVTQPGYVMCTPAYMAPEQADIRIEIDDYSCVDDYALGMVAYEILTGQAAYKLENGSMPSMLRTIINCPVQPLRNHDESLPRKVDDAVLKLLAKSHKKRASSADLRDAISNYFLLNETSKIVQEQNKGKYLSWVVIGALCVGLTWVIAKLGKEDPKISKKDPVKQALVKVEEKPEESKPLEEKAVAEKPKLNPEILWDKKRAQLRTAEVEVQETVLSLKQYHTMLGEAKLKTYRGQKAPILDLVFRDLTELEGLEAYFKMKFLQKDEAGSLLVLDPSNDLKVKEGENYSENERTAKTYKLNGFEGLTASKNADQTTYCSIPKSVEPYFIYKQLEVIKRNDLKVEQIKACLGSFYKFSNKAWVLRISQLRTKDDEIIEVQDFEYDQLVKMP